MDTKYHIQIFAGNFQQCRQSIFTVKMLRSDYFHAFFYVKACLFSQNGSMGPMDNIQEMADDYKDLLSEFKEAQKAEHDVDVVKLLYKEIVVWRKNFKKMDKAAKSKLDKHNTSCEETLKEVKKIIKVDQNIDEDVKKLSAIVMKFIEVAFRIPTASNSIHYLKS